MDLSPYLYVLPLELTPFLDVLAALGGQEAFSTAQYTTVLQVCELVCLTLTAASACLSHRPAQHRPAHTSCAPSTTCPH